MILNNSEILLEVKDLEVSFKTDSGIVKAVQNVSFTIRKGETLGIVGESGSGKSVTTLAIMRLLQEPNGRITNGEILFNSATHGKIDLAKTSEKDMREIRGGDIAMIFQEPMTSLNPVYTCGNQVMESILLHQTDIRLKENKDIGKPITPKEAKERTIEIFKKVKLPRPEKIFDSYPHQISGGQKQRVMIAMALSTHPALLIADEPTTALDVTVQASILELLRNLRDEQEAAIIFITHDLGVIAEIADNVMVMYRGKMMEKDNIWNIFDNPQHPYTKGLLACRPRLDLQMKVLPVVEDFMEVSDDDEIVEKAGHKEGMGNLLIENMIADEDIEERNKELASKPPILEIRNLSKLFPVHKGIFGGISDYVKAVDDVSFKVYPGETIGLVGESGCGKTTLGRAILRLIEPSSGDILFEGNKINELSKSEMRKLRREMQIVFQDPYSSLNPRLTVGDAIMEPMKIHNLRGNNKTRKERVIELLEKVNLKADHFNRYPHEFSGGQRQRICIARTLAVDPKFIICDESVSALDVSVQAQVLNLLNSLKEEFGLTYIFISHDLSVVKFMSDRIIVMNKGKIEEIDYANDIYDKPQTEYTRQLISSIPKGSLDDIRRVQMKRKNIDL